MGLDVLPRRPIKARRIGGLKSLQFTKQIQYFDLSSFLPDNMQLIQIFTLAALVGFGAAMTTPVRVRGFPNLSSALHD